eukprot:TRINITY_DN1074_c0_g1_i5.p1 TRINITY_DN1074_c0_g1~~TRINITY_DN1074_c0_g1_i5.p1  ORF type:complete len:777 (+),score=126.13 TRINITY_DN1074_c0_g1_i5:483-2813(+)
MKRLFIILDSYPVVDARDKPIESLKAISNWQYPGKGYKVHKLNTSRAKISSSYNGKVIHCHDMKGGYLESSMRQGGKGNDIYNFQYWKYIDILIYFSHHRFTIPPISWINCSHKNGVKILGTFITEWDGGKIDTKELLDGIPGNRFFYADQMIRIAKSYGFDGWFINFESNLPNKFYVKKTCNFLRYLTDNIHHMINGSLVIWYDSIIDTGIIEYQNGLNNKNECFLNSCDGIFLNYFWHPELIQQSVSQNTTRKFDIFTGIDIFGRNTFGGGGFDTPVALEVIKECDTSVALFAPGWVYECKYGKSRQEYLKNESKFWEGFDFIDLMDLNLEWTLENNGDGWNVRTDDNTTIYISSYEWCKRSKMFDLHNIPSINPTSLVNSQSIIVTVKTQGTGPNFEDYFYLKVDLLDEYHNIVASFNSGEIRTSENIQEIKYCFREYGSHIRYIYWEDGAKDVEHWSGHFGAKVIDPSILVNIDTKVESVSSYVDKYPSVFNIPFATSFNIGLGKYRFVDGYRTSDMAWNHFIEQDIPISYSENENMYLDDEDSYYGGSSLKIKSWNNIIVDIFESLIGIEGDFSLSYTYKTVSNTGNIGIILLDQNNEVICPNEASTNIKFLENDWKCITDYYYVNSKCQIHKVSICGEVEEGYQLDINLGLLYINKVNEILSPIDAVYHTSWKLNSLDTDTEIVDINLYWDTFEWLDHCNIYIFESINEANDDFTSGYNGRSYLGEFVITNIPMKHYLVYIQPVNCLYQKLPISEIVPIEVSINRNTIFK